MTTNTTATAWTSGKVTFAFEPNEQRNWTTTVNDAAGVVDDPLHDAEMRNLLITLTPADEVGGRKTWHVDIEGDIVNNDDDVQGHGAAPTTRSHCVHGCS